MKKNNKIKFEFKGLMMEMLSSERILNKFLNIAAIGVWLFGLSALIHAVTYAVLILSGK